MSDLEHRRPHVLFVGQSLPYPVDSGAHIRSYHTLRLVASGFDVSCLFYVRRAVRPTPLVPGGIEGIRAVPGVLRAEVVPVPAEGNGARLAWDHMRSLASLRAYTHYTYLSTEARGAVSRMGHARPFDLVHLDSLDLTAHIASFAGRVPIVVSHHNLESRLLRRRAQLSRGVRAAYLGLQARLTRREERRWIPEAALNLVVSELDLEAFREVAPTGRYAVLPNCVDTVAFRPDRTVQRRRGIVFLGGYDWEPNRDAMEFFCSRVLPRIRAQEPDYPVTWLAKTDQETGSRLSTRLGINVVGYVPEIRRYIARAACYVVPLRVGGGTRLKIVEAWAMGSAVVSTGIGAEGLECEDGRNILIADEEQAFADAVLRVVRDPDLQVALGTAARETAERHYDWNGQRDSLLSRYRQVVAPQVERSRD